MHLHKSSKTPIVNYLPIISPVSIAMSDGDVIRLNRMYKCGAAYETGDNPSTESKSTSSEIETENRTSTATIFGMFVFKIIPGN